jgi:hypothetical protein
MNGMASHSRTGDEVCLRFAMDQEEVLDLLQRSSLKTQYEVMHRAVDWLSKLNYIPSKTARAAKQAIELAQRENTPELLLSVALMVVPKGWNGDFSFGKGLKRSVLFSLTFVAYGDEPPIEAEDEIGAIALTTAAIKARP